MARKAKKAVADTKVSKKTSADGPDKFDEVGYKAGLPVDLDREMKSGMSLRDELEEDLGKWLDRAIDDQQEYIDKLPAWDRQYKGIKPEKSYPYPGAANTAIPVTRSRTDALLVRIFDSLFGQIKVWVVKALKPEFIDLAPLLEDGLDWWQKDIVKFRKKIFSPLLQCIKSGTGVVKVDYHVIPRTIKQYAGADEKGPRVYKMKNGQKVKEVVKTLYEGPDLFPISREDFIMPSEAIDIQESLFCGFRTYKRRNQLKADMRRGYYDEDLLDKVKGFDDIDEVKIERAETKGRIIKSDEKGLYEIWELHVRYDDDEDGEEDDLIVSFHRKSRTIMRAIYNPIFTGYRPFIPLIFYPSEFCFDGEGCCGILEKLQEELDMIHDMRMDRLTQINAPMYLVSSAANLDDFKIAPGLVRIVDGSTEGAVTELRFSDQYPSTFKEEELIVNYMSEAVGVTQAVMGQPVAERPVARETLALIEEANKKFKFGIENLRYCFAEIAWTALDLWAQYQPKLTYYSAPDGRAPEQKTVQFPLEYLRDGFKIEVMASSEMMNTEVRRAIDTTLNQLLSQYYTQLAGMVSAMINPGTPQPMKEFLFEVCKVGGKLMKNIVDDFGRKDSEALVPALDTIIDMEKVMAPPPPAPPPQQGPPPGQGGPPGGGAPGPGAMGAPPGPAPMGPGLPPMGPQPPMGAMPPPGGGGPMPRGLGA